MKWFKHNSTANMDAKLQKVLLDYGLEGYGLYWYCLELVAGNVEPENLTFELEHDCRIIARNTGSSEQRIQEMMNRFSELGLFENIEGRITCLKLAKLSDDYTSKLVRKKPPQVLDSKGVLENPTKTEKDPLDKKRLDKKKLDKNKTNKNKKSDPAPCVISEIFDFWKITMSKKRSKLSVTLKSKIQARLDDGFSSDDLRAAITGCAQSKFHMGDNDEGSLHNSVELIFRNANKTEEFIERNNNYQRRIAHEQNNSNPSSKSTGGITAADVFAGSDSGYGPEAGAETIREVNPEFRDSLHQPVFGQDTSGASEEGVGQGHSGGVIDGAADQISPSQSENSQGQEWKPESVSTKPDGVSGAVPAQESLGGFEPSRSQKRSEAGMHYAEAVEQEHAPCDLSGEQ